LRVPPEWQSLRFVWIFRRGFQAALSGVSIKTDHTLRSPAVSTRGSRAANMALRRERSAMFTPDTRKDFAHRLNSDGTADSICLYCFATIATTPRESELERAERSHFCWQREDAGKIGSANGRGEQFGTEYGFARRVS